VPAKHRHHTSNGCRVNLRYDGDRNHFRPTPDSFGSMLELTWAEKKSNKIESMVRKRKFTNDNDTVIMKGHCQNGHVRIGFKFPVNYCHLSSENKKNKLLTF
jgi:fumarylacetoacetase